MLLGIAFTMLALGITSSVLIGLALAALMSGSQYLTAGVDKERTKMQADMMRDQIAATKEGQKKQRKFLKEQQKKEKKERESQVKEIRQEKASQVEAREAQQFQNFLSQMISGAYDHLLMGGQPTGQAGGQPMRQPGPQFDPSQMGVPMSPDVMGAPPGGADVSAMLAMLGPETKDEVMQSAMQPAPSMAQGLYRLGIDDMMTEEVV